VASGDQGLFCDDCQLFYQLIAVDEKSPCHRVFFHGVWSDVAFCASGVISHSQARIGSDVMVMKIRACSL